MLEPSVNKPKIQRGSNEHRGGSNGLSSLFFIFFPFMTLKIYEKLCQAWNSAESQIILSVQHFSSQ